MKSKKDDLITNIVELDENKSLAIVKKRLDAQEDPLSIVQDCQKGMRIVGERYSEGKYFIAGLIMAGEILRQIMELIEPVLQDCKSEEKASGTILLGTVKDDIHDLGKNIVKMLFTCHGFTVYDLGVDVSPGSFVTEASKLKPDIIGLSGLITAAYDSMKETIALLKEETAKWPKKPYIIIGGSQIDEPVSNLVGTDYWANEADAGVRICKELMLSQL
ncbi:MAG: cobalamin-dependent protein [Bacillota bacterium]|nr:cobalamin-dependent protein [Bacillota bacterium]